MTILISSDSEHGVKRGEEPVYAAIDIDQKDKQNMIIPLDYTPQNISKHFKAMFKQ